MFGFFKMLMICFVAFVLILGVSIFNGYTLPKDEIIDTYNTFIQSFDFAGLSKDRYLKR